MEFISKLNNNSKNFSTSPLHENNPHPPTPSHHLLKLQEYQQERERKNERNHGLDYIQNSYSRKSD